ncbi:RHS repeat-associated core domain-containing protein, partial [Pseudomonas aegrilactucae]|uniref:RHS repeat-associated core domain-containing protein n=1 Tax=Pseudomonas aegrilactucae TaxID=2854028 RepID=UPI0020D235D4
TSRLGVETFAFDPAGNLLDDKAQQMQRPLDQDPKRNRLMDNLLREYAGTHYAYDERGNLMQRLHNGVRAQFTWDLFDRLSSYSDDKLKVEYSYDALGRRLHKHSVAHYWNKPQAGTGWNQLERAKRQRELECGFTLFGWDGDTLAWESSPPRDEGDTGRTVHYLYEPGSFVPVAQALRKGPVRLHKQPDWSQRSYDFDQDPLWQTHMEPQAFDAIAWYQCDHLGTPMELTDHNGEVAWTAQYKAWGEVREERSGWAKQIGLSNPIRFQGQYHDRETGLHYNRYRYYDPGVGRFLSQDPISYAGGLNLYMYAPSPVDWIDPLRLAKSGRTPPPTGKPNIDNRPCCAKKWSIERYDRKCNGHIPGVGNATLYRDQTNGRWYSADKAEHESSWKVFSASKGGGILEWEADLNEHGDVMEGKHKGPTGRSIDLRTLKCQDRK